MPYLSHLNFVIISTTNFISKSYYKHYPKAKHQYIQKCTRSCQSITHYILILAPSQAFNNNYKLSIVVLLLISLESKFQICVP